jgi:hypothetical protein
LESPCLVWGLFEFSNFGGPDLDVFEFSDFGGRIWVWLSFF